MSRLRARIEQLIDPLCFMEMGLSSPYTLNGSLECGK
jgi:hypothetical protein